jgi:hypothetical protein
MPAGMNDNRVPPVSTPILDKDGNTNGQWWRFWARLPVTDYATTLASLQEQIDALKKSKADKGALIEGMANLATGVVTGQAIT